MLNDLQRGIFEDRQRGGITSKKIIPINHLSGALPLLVT
ncbi:hypothetical protein ACZ87_02927 [Candidatus Erwinia dacicola]|uniref:Uncharacterized protein n=1 Tax=Candidatus Erwinia dacicola TaxID=252393 RepID=A0A328TIH4_9GAMM|nr:hypothetical protein ACZ87_02927 [Candidatus Erwinia dacicola]